MTRLVISTLALLAAAPALAQDVPQLTPGTEVRVRSPVASGRFVVHDHRAATLTLRDGTELLISVPIADVTELSILRGHRSAGASALHGAGIGLLVGAGSGILFGFVSATEPVVPVVNAVVDGAVWGGIGAAAGAALGAISRGEQWETVPLNTIRAGPSTDGGMTLGLVIRF
jgi:hypothetical protein